MAKKVSPKVVKKKNIPLFSDTSSLKLLGGGSLPQVNTPSSSLLETFSTPAPKRHFEISFSTNEFTSLCPMTGQPDFATITIRYIPKERCLESKSLKLYLQSFRNQGVFGESIVNRILDDLTEALSPFSLTVIGDFTARGGIGLRVEASYFSQKKSL